MIFLAAAALVCALGQRPATVVRVVDGDTVVMRLSLGFESVVEGPCRLKGIDAPELPTAEGIASRDWLRVRLAIGESVCFEGSKRDKYGRPLVRIFDDPDGCRGLVTTPTCNDGNVNQAIVAAGKARVRW